MLVASTVLHAWVALAASPRFTWHGGETCPSADEVLRSTARVLGRELDPHTIEIDAHVADAPGGGMQMGVSLSVNGVDEHYELWALDCESLAEDIAFLIASAIDPFVMLGPAPPRLQHPSERYATPAPAGATSALLAPAPAPVEPAAKPEAVHFEPLEAATTHDEDPTTRRELSGSLAASAMSFVGLFPNVGGGVQIEAGLERGLFRWQIGAAGWFGGRYRTGSDQGTELGADLLALSGATGLCIVPRVGAFVFALCGVGGAGSIRATPVNTTRSEPVSRPWGFVGADVRVSGMPHPSIGLHLGLSILPALARPVWAVSNPDARYTTPPVAGVLRLGIDLHPSRRRNK